MATHTSYSKKIGNTFVLHSASIPEDLEARLKQVKEKVMKDKPAGCDDMVKVLDELLGAGGPLDSIKKLATRYSATKQKDVEKYFGQKDGETIAMHMGTIADRLSGIPDEMLGVSNVVPPSKIAPKPTKTLTMRVGLKRITRALTARVW